MITIIWCKFLAIRTKTMHTMIMNDDKINNNLLLINGL
jgi:hypothetical protein